MIDPDDHIIDISEIDDTLDRLLAGDAPAPDAPAWCSDVAVLVRAVRAPAQVDELAGEDEIVRRMGEILAAGAAPAASAAYPTPAAETGPTSADTGPAVDPAMARLAASLLAPGFDPAATVLGADPEPTVVHLHPRRAGSDPARTGLDADARTPVGGAGPGTSALCEARSAAHRPRHAEDRLYRARHAAARLEASPHPVVRTFGRVIAVKAVAVTTAAVLSVAAAAATTGIVATVVVPALNDIARKPEPLRVTVDEPDDPDPSPSRADEPSSVACPMLATCDSTTPSTVPGSAASSTVPTTSDTTVPVTTAEATTTTADPTTDTTLSTTTTAPEPTSTTTTTETPPGTLSGGAQSALDGSTTRGNSGGRGRSGKG